MATTTLSPTKLIPLRDHLLKYAVRKGDFILKSGMKASYFIDAKQTMCRPEGMLIVADAMLDVMPQNATAIGGLTMGADPVAFGVAAVAASRGWGLNAFSVRKEAKDHGTGGRIAGVLERGDRVVIVEDAITRGTSVMEAVHVVKEFGARVVLVTAIVDRGGTCGRMAEAEGIPFAPLLTAPDLNLPYEGGEIASV